MRRVALKEGYDDLVLKKAQEIQSLLRKILKKTQTLPPRLALMC